MSPDEQILVLEREIAHLRAQLLDAAILDHEPITVWRCERCGKLAYGHQIVPSDDLPPAGDCGCWKGPLWVRGQWTPSDHPGRRPESAGGDAQ